jgi:archaellum component FlaG (FlaF/FlaG flagellin family)
MRASAKSPLARLVLVIICLAIAGSIVAGTHYYAVDLPQQLASPPQNPTEMMVQCNIYRSNCIFEPADKQVSCYTSCELLVCGT